VSLREEDISGLHVLLKQWNVLMRRTYENTSTPILPWFAKELGLSSRSM
jgi:hypothetical protein